MGIMTRFLRLCKADIHGLMDQMEDKGLLLKQYLRDMEEQLSNKEARLRKMVASREQLQREHEKYTRECEKLEQDLGVAIDKDKDDIARGLIKKLKPLAHHRDELGRHIEILKQEIRQFGDCVQEQRLQYEQLQLRSKEYFQRIERQQWEKSISSMLPPGMTWEAPEEEIELELLQRKEAKGGGEKG